MKTLLVSVLLLVLHHAQCGVISKPTLNKNLSPEGYWLLCPTGKVCFTQPIDIGCFENGPATKWCHQMALPMSPEKIDPQIILYNPEIPPNTPGYAQDIDIHELQITAQSLQFNASRSLFVVVHGFGGPPKEWMYPMRNALLAKGNNVILVRWLKGSSVDYFTAAANTRVMGAVVAKVLEALIARPTATNIALDHTTIVGFSLGAQISGFAGQRLFDDGFKDLRRIIGLDPAGPLYANGDPLYTDTTTHLNKNNANFVQCIHVNGLPLLNGGAGTMAQFGHLDFYANGGEYQPNCPSNLGSEIWNILDCNEGDWFHCNFSRLFDEFSCSHDRAPWIFTASILNAGDAGDCKYLAAPCASPADYLSGKCLPACTPEKPCFKAGYETDIDVMKYGTFQQKYFFSTRADNTSASLFCGRPFIVTLESADISVKGKIKISLRNAEKTSELWEFQSSTETLSSGTSKARIVEADFAIQTPTQLDILYTKPSTGGVDHFVLGDISVRSREMGCGLKAGAMTMISNGETASVSLTPNNGCLF